MPDASWLRIDQDEWKVLTCQVHAKPRGDEKFAPHWLFVRQHPDGRILVYVVLAPAQGEIAIASGEVADAGSGVESVVRRVARWFSIPHSLANECLAVLLK